MIERELYIEGVLVDLEDATNVALTRQANNIAEIQNRQGDFSNQFTLPYTPTNREVMEHAQIVNSSSTRPYRQLTARYMEEGLELVQEGIATLIDTIEAGYVIQVTSGNNSFFGKFPDTKVSDLIGNTLDHLNTFANITTSRSNTSGYIYPLINWFDDSDPGAFTTSSVNTRYLLPCIFVKDIFRMVDTLTGFQSLGRLTELEDFDNLILTPNALQRGQEAIDLYNAEASNSSEQSFLVGIDNGVPAVVAYLPVLDNYSGLFNGNLFTADAGLFGYFVFSGALRIDFTQYEFSSRLIKVRTQVIASSGPTIVADDLVFNYLTPLDPGENIISQDLYFSAISNNITFAAGDTYFVRVLVEDPLKSEVFVIEDMKFRFELLTAIPYGGFMPVGELYGGITVKQVYQDVMNMYAVIPQTNSFRNEVSFGLFEQLTENTPKAKVWSAKVQPKGHRLGYKFGKYGQSNLMLYNPTETVTAGYGDSSFEIDDDTLPGLVTAVSLSVSAVEDAAGYQNVNYPRIKALANTTRAHTATGHRLLLLDRKNTAYTHTYTDGTNTLTTGTDIPYATFRPLLFDNLKAAYYTALLSALVKAKAPAYRVQLTRQDVQELDYLVPIYLDVHTGEIDVSAYFYLSRISGYLNGFASAELVRL